MTFSELHREVRARLRTLSKENAEVVGCHLVMAGRLLDLDPELAYEHAQAAVRRGGRVDVVREAAGLAAYQTGRHAEALRELRTVRRLSGSAEHLAVMADCERGLGRPERAVALASDADASTLSHDAAVELAIVVSGARLDLGEPEAALVALDQPAVHRASGLLAVRVAQARAVALEAAGRSDEAAAELAGYTEDELDRAAGNSPVVDDDIVVYDLTDEEETEPDAATADHDDLAENDEFAESDEAGLTEPDERTADHDDLAEDEEPEWDGSDEALVDRDDLAEGDEAESDVHGVDGDDLAQNEVIDAEDVEPASDVDRTDEDASQEEPGSAVDGPVADSDDAAGLVEGEETEQGPSPVVADVQDRDVQDGEAGPDDSTEPDTDGEEGPEGSDLVDGQDPETELDDSTADTDGETEEEPEGSDLVSEDGLVAAEADEVEPADTGAVELDVDGSQDEAAG
ncbi:MAG: hypothetical protein FWF02_10665 [Micrococcales bacterium]|nr:hypothetical protein [Micrococcales bacterium]MCL2668148.1 hypothetical protein [Micrococcales bacterium]